MSVMLHFSDRTEIYHRSGDQSLQLVYVNFYQSGITIVNDTYDNLRFHTSVTGCLFTKL